MKGSLEPGVSHRFVYRVLREETVPFKARVAKRVVRQ